MQYHEPLIPQETKVLLEFFRDLHGFSGNTIKLKFYIVHAIYISYSLCIENISHAI